MSDREINLRSALFLVIGILLLLSLLICVFIVGGERDLVQIDASVVEKEPLNDGSGKYNITLSYDVDGKTYHYSYEDKNEIEVDDTVVLYYHSKNVTSVQPFKTSKLIFICPLVGLIICIIGIVELFKKNNHEQKVDYQTSVIGVIGDTRQLKIITDDAPVHQYEMTPEEMAETQVKTIKKEYDVEEKGEQSKDAFIEIRNGQVENQVSEEVETPESKIEVPSPTIQREISVPKAPTIQHMESKVVEPVNVQTIENDQESFSVQNEVAPEVIPRQIPKEDVEEQESVESNIQIQEQNNEAFQQLMQKVNQIQEIEQQKAEVAKANSMDETQTIKIPISEVNKKMVEASELTSKKDVSSQNEIINKIQKAAKENSGLGEEEIKSMIKDALKEVISEVKEDTKKPEIPLVQKRVLPNYFYISGTSLIYEEPGKDSKELNLKTIKSVVRTINSEGNVVKLVVSNEEVKCILTNMKNIDLEQVANLLHNKMSTIDENFNEIIEHKEY